MTRPLPPTTLPALAELVTVRPELAGLGIADAVLAVTA